MVWKIILVFLTSTVKFLFAPAAAIGIGFSILQTILITSVGGVTGVVIFFYLSTGLQQRAFLRRKKLEAEGLKKPKKKFTRANKTIVKIKRSLGLPGIAFLTLPFISIPVCVIITAKFFRHRNDALPFLISSILIWSVALTYLYSFI
ncbi:MAG: hypothetical protein V4616_14555 [Bacteroidota bacterium]